ncbi:hypothetical protein [Prevotella sp. OH937_COT-195]|uniref:hypothetical protein n=1 Tax=Prevotella sp. OH937_COT-195 TaxID=2491051 RepID=UPI000F64A2D5|nr:hypothetical protein [Prevotella sp. OH937_COT-195]RRC97666.1 hypothetical protein EII32_10250 [Prevotella sp. OH937_COT-195]
MKKEKKYVNPQVEMIKVETYAQILKSSNTGLPEVEDGGNAFISDDNFNAKSILDEEIEEED